LNDAPVKLINNRLFNDLLYHRITEIRSVRYLGSGVLGALVAVRFGHEEVAVTYLVATNANPLSILQA
jgi:hypothetical protein